MYSKLSRLILAFSWIMAIWEVAGFDKILAIIVVSLAILTSISMYLAGISNK